MVDSLRSDLITADQMSPELPRLVPKHLLDSILRYINYGVPVGDFLEAIINNDLTEAIGRADETSLLYLKEIVQVFFNYAPMNSWKSQTAYQEWQKKGGIAGLTQAASDAEVL